MSSILPSYLALTVAEIREDARFSGDKVDNLGGETKLTGIIERRIEDMGALVLGRLQSKALAVGLTSSLDNDLAGILTAVQKRNALTASRFLVIATLHNVTPSEASATIAKALQDGRGEAIIGDERLGSAASLLRGLISDFDAMATAAKTTGGAEAIEVGRA